MMARGKREANRWTEHSGLCSNPSFTSRRRQQRRPRWRFSGARLRLIKGEKHGGSSPDSQTEMVSGVLTRPKKEEVFGVVRILRSERGQKRGFGGAGGSLAQAMEGRPAAQGCSGGSILLLVRSSWNTRMVRWWLQVGSCKATVSRMGWWQSAGGWNLWWRKLGSNDSVNRKSMKGRGKATEMGEGIWLVMLDVQQGWKRERHDSWGTFCSGNSFLHILSVFDLVGTNYKENCDPLSFVWFWCLIGKGKETKRFVVLLIRR